MATTNLNGIILAAARRLKAARTDPTSNGDSSSNKFTSALLTEYTNRAVRELLLELFQQFKDEFGNAVPEYIATSGGLTLVAGAVAVPADCFLGLDLVKSDRTVKFYKLMSKQVEDIRTGQDGMIVPSATRPVFWIEGRTIYTLGLIAGDVIFRYIKTHSDIVPTTAPVDNGIAYTTAANIVYTAATKTITINDQVGGANAWLATDSGRDLIFYVATPIVYQGKIVSVTFVSPPFDATIIQLAGDGLPAGDIAAPNILGAFTTAMSAVDYNDLKLNNNWVSKHIIDRVVQLGEADAKAGIL